MSQVLFGPRLGKEGVLRVGCSAVIFDKDRSKVLLTQRTDNGRWCLPGGQMEAGESASEACEREVWEETGLKVRATRLLGVYSNPDQLVIYNDGSKAFFVVLNFEVEVIEGELGLSNETTAFGYYSLEEMESMPMHGEHKSRVEDSLRNGDTVMK
ncbi:MAG: NUDIX domain-containing protein [Anaerolineales bacterium]|jgi:ADP-ribose pyrophosphatase YjhB (NUDIX family)|uniref:NUDIX domain-containing protein n=1 Tax=Candidatus Villigracilis vicinus TaxID=3140679 RepID=UPI003136C3BA|nr:NUDIX domain-containing protein [Anaerolineales bacterium]